MTHLMWPLHLVLTDIRELHFLQLYKTVDYARYLELFPLTENLHFISLSHLSEKRTESQNISWTLSSLFRSSVDYLVGYIKIKKYLISSRFELGRECNTLWVEDGAGCVLWFFFFMLRLLNDGKWWILILPGVFRRPFW